MFKQSRHIITDSIQKIGLVMLSLALLAIWLLGIENTMGQKVEEVRVSITSIEGVRNLIDEKDVFSSVEAQSGNDLNQIPIRHLDLRKIETALQNDTRVYKAEVFVDAQKTLVIDVEQRRPIVRFMANGGDEYYLDQEGFYVNKTEFRAVRVPVVTGYVDRYSEEWKEQPFNRINKAFEIATVIHKDAFLQSLIEQIHFERESRIILIPKIGKEKIVLKYMDELDQKLKRLKPFYKNLAKTNAWGKYAEIDISYNKQVVGRNPVKP